jgi:hypothetical protein
VSMQVIDVAIGVVAAFFVLSIMASAIVEIISFALRKRSRDLQIVLNALVARKDPHKNAELVLDIWTTSTFRALKPASNRKIGWKKSSVQRGPSYVSARSFADAVVEALSVAGKTPAEVRKSINSLPDGLLKTKLELLDLEVQGDLTSLKAGIEGWFDETMDRLEGAYKRWTQQVLLVVGICLAGIFNISIVRVVDSLWNDATLRTTVSESAVALTNEAIENRQSCLSPTATPSTTTPAAAGTPAADSTPTATPTVGSTECLGYALEDLSEAFKQVDTLRLPMGWGSGWGPIFPAWTILGWIPMGLATMLGAPFWFDMLTRLAGIRQGRGKPPKANDDPVSATAAIARA